ncbi:zinc metalloproteinase nas-39-like [Ptychodera flava]|uniref:zinc metalloproteinase nas-39-like n=1 Tax=Ptychodera flava TaxID=63121 RepID=UPI00396A488D
MHHSISRHIGSACLLIAILLVSMVITACPPTTDSFIDDGENYIFFSPRWPRSYLSGEYCSYHISTIPGNNIYLEFLEFKVEPHSACIYDNVKIFDGAYLTNTSLGTYCDHEAPQGILSSHNHILVTFESDETANDDGFRAIAVSVAPGTNESQNTNGISLTTLNAEKGTITSAGYPYKYRASQNEQFVITTTEDSSVLRLFFLDFDVEPAFGCRFDYVAVYNGNSTSEPMIGKYCGEKINRPPKVIQSSSESLCIEFITDGSDEYGGFLADFKSVAVGSVITNIDNDDGSCDFYQFPCLNGFCVHEGVICDGIDDCGDKSDEFCQAPRIESSDAGAAVFVGCFIGGAVICILVATVMFFINAKKQNRARAHTNNFTEAGVTTSSVHTAMPLAPGQHIEKGTALSYITYAKPR